MLLQSDFGSRIQPLGNGQQPGFAMAMIEGNGFEIDGHIAGVVEDKVLEVDEFAAEPQPGAGVNEVGSLDPAHADRRTGDAPVETHQRDPGVRNRPQEAGQVIFVET
ncbi:hypothetical protein [Rhizobium leguminosarum]